MQDRYCVTMFSFVAAASLVGQFPVSEAKYPVQLDIRSKFQSYISNKIEF